MHIRFHARQGVTALVLAAAAVISACGSAPQAMPPIADASINRPVVTAPAAPAAPASRALPALPPAGSGRGGYYRDDGPGDAPPDGLYEIPDAEPKVEPYTRRGNRPYVVFGKSYRPFTDDRPFKQRGIGSWYGKKFHGQTTSSGEIYDMYKMTAAHPTLPLPSYVRVTNLANGKQVIVRVNDRGPFHASRIIDLSYTAALKLEYVAKGSAQLEVERLLPDEIARINSARINSARQGRADAGQTTSPGVSVPGTPVQPAGVMPDSASNKSASQSASVTVPQIDAAEQRVPDQAIVQPTVGATSVVVSGNVATGGFYLQLGAYGSAANAETMRSRLAQSWSGTLPQLEVVQNGALYRIYSGPFATRGEAYAASRQVQPAGASPVIVQR
jgi:rare lipoprotein A